MKMVNTVWLPVCHRKMHDCRHYWNQWSFTMATNSFILSIILTLCYILWKPAVNLVLYRTVLTRDSSEILMSVKPASYFQRQRSSVTLMAYCFSPPACYTRAAACLRWHDRCHISWSHRASTTCFLQSESHSPSCKMTIILSFCWTCVLPQIPGMLLKLHLQV